MTFLPLKNRNACEFVVVVLTATALSFFCFEFVSRSNAASTPSSNNTVAKSTRLAGSLAAPAGTSYTWIGGTPAFTTDWQVSTNWSPIRSVPAPDDVLVFNTISIAPASTGTVSGQIILQDAAHKVQASDANGIKFQNGSIFTTSTGFSGNPFGAGTNGSIEFQSGASSFFNAGGDPFGGSGHSIATFDLSSSQTFNAATAFSSDGRTYGNLTLDGSQSYSGSGTNALTIFNTLNIATGSTLTLSNSAGGDLNLLGDITINGTLDQNARTIKFQGGGSFGGNIQTITNGGTFDDVIISKTVGSVTLGNTTTINGALQFNGTSLAVDVLELNSKTLNLNGTVGGTSSSTSNGFKGDSTGATLNIGGTGALFGTVRFISGARALTSLTVNRTSSATVILGTALVVGDASTGSVTLTNGVINMGTNTLLLSTAASITGGTNGYVIGSLEKNFGPTGLFTFTVGTANGYSPVDANVTSGGGGFLTVKAVQGKHPAISDGTTALQRYWSLSNFGITADLTFHYLGTDVMGTEANYKIFKYLTGSFSQFTPNALNTATHTAQLLGVSAPTLSDWTLAQGWQVQFNASKYTTGEGDSGTNPVTITVQRVGGTTGTASVHWATSDGTATAGSDYVAASGDLSWANGDGADKTFTVTVNGDTVYEANETVNLTLSGATGGVTGGTNPATLTILNDDRPPAALTVNTTDDLDNGFCLASHCSLREAINAANLNADTNTINFDPAVFASPGNTIDLSSALPSLSTNMVVNGPGSSILTVQRSTAGGTPAFRILAINSGSNVSLSGLTISNGQLSDRGAGISNYGNLTILNCTISGNTEVTGGWGGGIYNDRVATLNVTDSIIIGNSASDAGGIGNFGALAVTNSTISGNSSSGSGGGIRSFSDSTLTVTNSTVSGNTATDAGGGIESLGAATLTNTTISGNIAGGSGGGLVRNGSTATATLTNVTITNNHAGTNGGGALLNGGNDKMRNTIVTGNFFGSGTSTPDDISGVVDTSAASSNNLIGTGGTGGLTAINGNQINVTNPGLAPLANNGGPTFTHALLAGSPALDAGSNALSDAAGLTDQRGTGFIRKADSADANTTQTVDIGAFEAQAAVEDITDKPTAEDTPLSFSFNVGDANVITNVTASSGNPTLVPNAPANINVLGSGSTRTLNINPAANQFGSSTITVTVTSGAESMSDTFVLTVTAVADPPSVTNATTNEDTQTTSGLVINRNAADGTEVTHFKIANITNGTLFKNDGTTQINDNQFITVAEGNAGLKFTPAANLFSPSTVFSLDVQGATDGSGSGLSSATSATITVTPIADTPSVTPATTTINTQTTAGLVISRSAADGSEVTHFKITNITNGTLFKNDGTTQILNGTFITFGEGHAGLRFTPSHNLASPSSAFSFQVQGATSGIGDGLSSAATATITVNCGADDIVTNTNDGGAGSLRNAIDTACPGETITFNIPTSDPGFSGGVYTITLTSAELVIDKNLTINGLGTNVLTVKRSTAGGTPSFRIFRITGFSTVNISGMTVANGLTTPGNDGGAISTSNGPVLTLINVKVSGNATADAGGIRAGFGGAIFNRGTLTLMNSTVSGNFTGKGVFSGPGKGGNGGGIYIPNGGVLNVVNSTISGNATGNGFPGGNSTNTDGDGGGIYNAGTTNMINSTISNNTTGTGNSSSFGGQGAGIDNATGGALTLRNCTVAGNIASRGVGGSAGGGIIGGGTLSNSMIASNIAANGPDLLFTYISQDYNLIGNTSGATINGTTTHNIVNVSASLSGLASNGGQIQTMLPLPDSPAINAGDPANLPADTFDLDGDGNTSEPLPVDQRGFPRVVAANFDIGAVETNYTITTTAGTPQSAVIGSNFAMQLQATVKESGINQSGITVTFTAPASGASGTFAGNVTTANVTTDASGVATAPVFTANGNAGSYNVSASVGTGLASTTFALTNTKAATITAVSSSVNPSEFSQSVTFTATVTSGAGTPTGTVQFKDGGVSIGLASTVNGVAQLTTSSLTAGPHTITADYSGDANFLTSSGTLSGGQVVKSQPSLSINDVTLAEGNSATTNFVFTVTLSAASNLTVNVDYATANGTATVADNDYQVSSGTLTFNPGDLTKTITVLVNGDQKFEPDETVFVNLTNAVNATISDNQGVGTILNDDTLQLILDESGPDGNQAAAFDSLLFVRDPFHVQSIATWLDLGPDRNTRVIIFAANLQLNQGETASNAVTVSLVDASNHSFDVPAEDVRPVPNFGFAQVRFRLPDSVATGPCLVTVKAHGQISNTGTIGIVLP